MPWDVNNPKGRIGSILSAIIWIIFIMMIVIKGDLSMFPLLLLILFVLLLVLSFVRIYQEWIEEGEWLE
jgi:hypothetical protein